jgi:hypothetical protein
LEQVTRAALLLLLAATAAVADEPPLEQARMYFDAGRQAYEAGDYATAIRSFEQAYRDAPKPPIAFSLAQAYRKQYVVDNDAAKLKAAVNLYRKYLDEVPQGGRREDAVTYLGELQPQLLRLEAVRPVTSAPVMAAAPTQLMVMSRVKDARVAIDGAAPAPVPVTRAVEPGPHQIHAEAPGYFPEELDGMAVAGNLVVVEASLREQPARLALRGVGGGDVALDGRQITDTGAAIETPAGSHVLTVSQRGHVPLARALTLERGQTVTVDADLRTTAQRKISYVVLATAGALLVATATTTSLALAAQDNARDLLDRRDLSGWSAADLDEYNRQRGRRDDLATASYILGGATAAAAVAGLLLYFVDSPAAEAPAAGAPLVPVVAPDEIGAAFVHRF